jgi:eukaryotic-like serine/threonine-protein kinase
LAAAASVPAAAAATTLPVGVDVVPAPAAGVTPAPVTPVAKPPAPQPPLAQAPRETARDRRAREARERAAAAAATATPAVVALGTVRIAVSPWGNVEVDGTAVGTAPPLNELTLSEGRHQITVRNADFPPFSTSVNVVPGQPVTLRHRFGS